MISKLWHAKRMVTLLYVELGGLRRQARFDVAQALSPRHLREGYRSELLSAAELARPHIAFVGIDDAPETGPRHEVHYRGEQGLADVHARLRVSQTRIHCRVPPSHASRYQNSTGLEFGPDKGFML
jgi:hypothetical protein